MKRLLILSACLLATELDSAETRELHFKSPAAGMHFTAGCSVQVWADIIPRDDDHPGWPQAECRWDGQLIGARVNGNNKAFDYFPFTVPAALVTPGIHTLKLNGFGREGPTVPPDQTMSVHIDPWPAEKTVVELKEDMTFTDLNWSHVAVRGNGHTVAVSGKLTIDDSLVTGLGSMTIVDPSHADPNSVVSVAGMTGTLNGDVLIRNSIFEATGSLSLSLAGAGETLIRNNEFRANNFIKFVPSRPEASPIVQISGQRSGRRLFQGNRIGAGIVRFEGASGWLIGGDSDAESNVMIGPRCVLSLEHCRDMHVIGNYIHHDYRGTWSQGFNFYCENSDGILAEHNILRSSSWPLQTFGGEFRYNLMVDAGHNWVRVLTSGTKFHHNLLVHTGDPYGTGIGAGIWLYENRKKVEIYNNTFDGGDCADFDCPIISLSAGCNLATLRNNVFTGVHQLSSLQNNAIVARGGHEKAADARVTYADYNCFFNPHAASAANYEQGINEQQGAGAHDVTSDPKFAAGRVIPYAVNEENVWNRKRKVSGILSFYRARYAPGPGSPLPNGGDPADGKGSYIGAIGPEKDRLGDRFGEFSSEATAVPR